EVGNHSFNHEPWLHLYSEEEIASELQRAEEAIATATGERPIGFRGPGFSFSSATLNVLSELGYLYDASTFPTYLGPLARAYYFMTANLPKEEQEKRKQLFGQFNEGFRPLKPYFWDFGSSDLLEIPVTTMPLFKVPFHLSYILYLGTFSNLLAKAYFKTALTFCRIAGVEPSILLHPLDFMGCDDTEELSFFPAMRQKSKAKVELATWVLSMFKDSYNVVPMRDHARNLLDRRPLPQLDPLACKA
ncbi:MAG: polysaccharide deacetylase family protein, partial [Verrucomicrobiota bacterium]